MLAGSTVSDASLCVEVVLFAGVPSSFGGPDGTDQSFRAISAHEIMLGPVSALF